jgi:hypothetical protein
MAIQIRHNGWNLSVKMWNIPVNERIEDAYRTIKAESLEAANKFMLDNYNNIENDIFYGEVQISFNECHYINGSEYSYIVTKKVI